ncbi:hypothetical protein OIU77_002977 [Salix suchowensis]|uniref:Uncharacterized protein n=1 Tax=Salix suchowensis TaxID=1278906 RepID=A0ABQ9AY04_9ROSI|nr:hypothetical protein OIU77_002977 [Salix suchowensis]
MVAGWTQKWCAGEDLSSALVRQRQTIPEKKQRRDDHRSAKKMNSMRSGLKKSVKDGKVSTPKVDSDDVASNKKLPIEILLGPRRVRWT